MRKPEGVLSEFGSQGGARLIPFGPERELSEFDGEIEFDGERLERVQRM